MESAGVTKMAIGDESRLRQGAEQGPDWFLVATEACGGGTPGLGFFSGVSVFIRIFGVGLTSGGLRVIHEAGGVPSTLMDGS